jgi:ABC-type nitrate/sulfonate/bicarbonate transport system substrate-binding protein
MRSVALIAIVGLFLALMGVANLALAADKITVGLTNPTAFDWETFVADDRGFFSAQGLEVSATYMAPDLPIKALLAGSVDLVKCGTHFGIIAAARGAEAKIVGGSIYGYPYDVISQPQFQTLADLRGQKIAGANPASITTVIFRDLMARQGLGPADYSILWIGGSRERFQAVLSGQVAASLAEGPPFNLRAVEGGKKVLVRYGDQVKDLQYTSYFTSLARSQSRPLVVRYLRAAGQAMRWLNDPRNEREAVQILARRLKIDETLATRSYAYMVTEHRAFRGEGKNDGPGLAEMIRLLADAQLIPRREPWESYVDHSFTTPSP